MAREVSVKREPAESRESLKRDPAELMDPLLGGIAGIMSIWESSPELPLAMENTSELRLEMSDMTLIVLDRG
jgi:hypothetical protein